MDGKVSVKLYSFNIWQECYSALAWCLCEELWRLHDLNFLSSLNSLENKTLLTYLLYKFTKTKSPLTLVCVAFQKKRPNQNSFTFHDWILTGNGWKMTKPESFPLQLMCIRVWMWIEEREVSCPSDMPGQGCMPVHQLQEEMLPTSSTINSLYSAR